VHRSPSRGEHRVVLLGLVVYFSLRTDAFFGRENHG
jgi:hypothetical protein